MSLIKPINKLFTPGNPGRPGIPPYTVCTPDPPPTNGNPPPPVTGGGPPHVCFFVPNIYGTGVVEVCT